MENAMKIDNFYFVVENVEKSISFYSELFGMKPSSVIDNRWADWGNSSNQIYFGIISKKATDTKLITGNNAVLGLYTHDIKSAYEKCVRLKAKILYEPISLPDSKDNYTCFAIEDPDGNKIEISYYDK